MIEVEWWDYDDAADMADAVASDIEFIIDSALDARGESLIALPGGPRSIVTPVFARLAESKLNWKRVTIVPTDERLVAPTDPLSNVGVIARVFLPLGARVIPLAAGAAADHRKAGLEADERLAALRWPPDLVWLGVGADGHAGSILPGPDLETMLSAPAKARAIGLKPEPMPKDAPAARISLTRSAILAARTLLVTVSGKKARTLVEAALDDEDSDLPVARLLADAEQAIDIHWCSKD